MFFSAHVLVEEESHGEEVDELGAAEQTEAQEQANYAADGRCNKAETATDRSCEP